MTICQINVFKKGYRVKQMIISFKKYIKLLFPALLLAFAALPVFASAPALAEPAERRIITVGYTEISGLSETDSNGRPYGMIIDYLDEISKYTNWEYEYIQSDNLVEDFLTGQFDLIGGNYYLPELEENYAYPKYSMGSSLSTLFCRRDDYTIKSYELSSINGKTIGVYDQATENIRRLKAFLSSNNLDCELKYYSYEAFTADGTIYEYLENGEIDLLLGNAFDGDHELRLVTAYPGQPYYIVAHVGDQELIDGLNMALERILDSDPQFHEKHYNAHFPDLVPTIHMNEKDLAYVKEKQTVSVAVVRNMHPFCCLDNEEESHNGIIPDLLDAVSAFSGLSFTYVYADTYTDSLRMLQNGEVDLLGCYLDSEMLPTSESFVLTNSYVTMNNIMVKNKSVSYPREDAVIGIQQGRTLPADLTSSSIQYFSTVADGLTATNNGEIDVYYGLATSMERELQRHRFLNIVPIALVNQNTSISFAMNRPADTQLLTIMNKAIAGIPTEDLNTISSRNMVSMGYSSLSISELIYANPLAFVTIFSIFILMLVLLFLLYQRNRIRTSLIQTELEKTESKNKAKSVFLSRMSHEIRTPMNAIVGLVNLTCMEENLPPAAQRNLQKLLSSAQYLLSLINDILDMSRIESGKLEIQSDVFSLRQLVEELDNMMRLQAMQKQITFTLHCSIEHTCLLGDAVRLRQVLINLLSNAIKFTPSGGCVSLQIEELAATPDRVEFTFSVADTGVGIEPEHQEQIFDSFEQFGTNSSKSAGTGLGLPISRSIVAAMGGNLELSSTPGEGSVFFFRLTFSPAQAGDIPDADKNAPLSDLHGIRILVAEDNDLNAEITQELLATLGAKTERAENGQAALDQFFSSSDGYYSLILMDIRMPVKDGLQACREIRASSHPQAASIPIIAFTANSFREDSDSALAAGMNGFVPKPIDLDYLKQVVSSVLIQK